MIDGNLPSNLFPAHVTKQTGMKYTRDLRNLEKNDDYTIDANRERQR